MTDIFQRIKKKWPSTVVARTSIKEFSGGLFREKYLANLDSEGKGPVGRFRIGRKIVYPIDELITWMKSRMNPLSKEEKKNVEPNFSDEKQKDQPP